MSDKVILSNVCSKIVDCEHKTAPEAAPGSEYGYSIGTPNIRGGRLLLSTAKRVDKGTFDAWTAREVPRRNDIILAREAPVGQAAFLDGSVPVCLGQRTVLLRPDPHKIDPRYLHYRLLSPAFQEILRSRSEGSTVPHLNVSDIKTVAIGSLPSLSEQRAIASLLGALDDKIAANGKIAATGEALVVALSSDEQQTMTVPLKEIVDHVKDQVLPETLVADRVAHYSIPAFDSTRLPEMAMPGSIKSSKFIISAASVLVSKLNPSIPRVWNVDPSRRVPALASTEFLVLRPSQGITTDEVWAVCGQPSFTVSLAGKVNGTSNSHQRVKPADLLATQVVDPRALPAEVRGSISAVARQVHQARIESQSLACLRDALLPKLMSGEIRVRDAERIVEDAT